MSILIKNGTIITSTQTIRADVLIEGDKITNVSPNFSENADKVIDANGMYILPGGVDPHVHLYLPTPAGYSSDDFKSGSISALYGGTTTLIDFVTPTKKQSIFEALSTRIKEAENSLVDYTFHVSPVDWHENSEKEIVQCIDNGFPSFKIYMAYKETVGLKDDDIYHVMRVVGQNGGMVTTHCELGDEVNSLRDSFVSQNQTSPLYHMLSRPAKLESNAVKRAIAMADQANCPLYIVHVSAGESLKHIQQAQKSGQPVYAETCPHYLLLDESNYNGDFEQTAKFILSPPLRTKDDMEQLWNGINSNILQTIGTDHCPFSLEQKSVGRNDFRKSPNGAGGVEHRLALLYTYGVLQNRFSLNKLVDLFSTQPAKIFGLYPQKGEIAIGSDADIVVWNPDAESAISVKTHHSQADLNIFEGTATSGEAKWVIVNGNIAIENSRLNNNIPVGKLLRRKSQKSTNLYYKRSLMDDPTSNNCGRV
ncbi:MAG: dihydropyrimidinase [Bacteroidales bacterium]